jgi:hypothetical protein
MLDLRCVQKVVDRVYVGRAVDAVQCMTTNLQKYSLVVVAFLLLLLAHLFYLFLKEEIVEAAELKATSMKDNNNNKKQQRTGQEELGPKGASAREGVGKRAWLVVAAMPACLYERTKETTRAPFFGVQHQQLPLVRKLEELRVNIYIYI